MIRHMVVFAVALVSTSSAVRAEDPKVSQLKTKTLFTVTAPDLKGGVIFPGGALDLSTSPAAMIRANFKPPLGLRFVQVKMIYKGEYLDPNSQIAGYLYHLKNETYDRYFFVSKNDIPGALENERYVIDYDALGNPLAYFRGAFALRP